MNTDSNQKQDEPEVSPEVLAKARRATVILYVVMILLIAAPFLYVWLFR